MTSQDDTMIQDDSSGTVGIDSSSMDMVSMAQGRCVWLCGFLVISSDSPKKDISLQL